MASQGSKAGGLAERYATAMFELADSEKRLDDVAADLEGLAVMVRESDDLARLIRSPIASREDQVKALTALAEKAGMTDLTRRFVGVMARNRRLFALSAAIRAFQDLLSDRRGETSADVVSARKLTEKQLSNIRAALKKVIGGEVAVETRVDPDLLGGLVVRVGSRMMDASLRTQLQRLRLAMKGVG